MSEWTKEEESKWRTVYSNMPKGELIKNILHWRKRFVEDLEFVNVDARVKMLTERLMEARLELKEWKSS